MRRINWLKWLIYVIITALTAVIQALPQMPHLFQGAPLFCIPLAVAVAMHEGENVGAAFAVLAGLLWDMQTGRNFGFNALFLLACCVAIGLFVRYMFLNTLFAALLFTLCVTLIVETLTWFFFYYMTGIGQPAYFYTRIILPTTGLTAVFAIPYYYLFGWLHRKLEIA